MYGHGNHLTVAVDLKTIGKVSIQEFRRVLTLLAPAVQKVQLGYCTRCPNLGHDLLLTN